MAKKLEKITEEFYNFLSNKDILTGIFTTFALVNGTEAIKYLASGDLNSAVSYSMNTFLLGFGSYYLYKKP